MLCALQLRITGDSQDDLESAVEQICQMAVLGSGDVDMCAISAVEAVVAAALVPLGVFATRAFTSCH